MSVISFPGEKRHPRDDMISAREMYAIEEEPSQEVVWSVCPWLRHGSDDNRCLHCPRTTTDPDYGEVMRGCYHIAIEAWRVIIAAERKFNGRSLHKSSPDGEGRV